MVGCYTFVSQGRDLHQEFFLSLVGRKMDVSDVIWSHPEVLERICPVLVEESSARCRELCL